VRLDDAVQTFDERRVSVEGAFVDRGEPFRPDEMVQELLGVDSTGVAALYCVPSPVPRLLGAEDLTRLEQ
jgi:hypothetical protein